MTYFIAKVGNQFVVNVIEAMNHTQYNQIFGYDGIDWPTGLV
jgi:hypothetical protein